LTTFSDEPNFSEFIESVVHSALAELPLDL
jgi:hypothetical protein